MFRNNAVNDISGSSRLNVRYDRQNKGRLRNSKSQKIGLGATVGSILGAGKSFNSFEEGTDEKKIKINIDHQKEGAVIASQQANIGMLESRKRVPEHNRKIASSESRPKLPMNISQSLEQNNRQFGDQHDWSQLSTSKICKILEDISGKRHKTWGRSTSLQEKNRSHKVLYERDNEGSQDWSQIPSESICELIEKIATRRNRNLKQHAYSQDQEISEVEGLSEGDKHNGEIEDPLEITARRGSENSKGYKFALENDIPNAVCFSHKEAKLMPPPQKRIKNMAVIPRNQHEEFILGKLNNQLVVSSKLSVSRLFNAMIVIVSHSQYQTYLMLQSKNFGNIWDFGRRPVLPLKPDAAYTIDTSNHVTLPWNIFSDFATIVPKNQLYPKKHIPDCNYELLEFQQINCNFGTQPETLYHFPMSHDMMTIKEKCSPELQLKNEAIHEDFAPGNEKYCVSCLKLKKDGTAYHSNGMNISCKLQSAKDKEEFKLDNTNSVQDNVNHYSNIFVGLRAFFHKIYSKNSCGEIDLSETLFYNDSKKSWVKMGDLAHRH
ncbi:hypothetical protein SKDZ_02G2910 [Saccharomyces kudriavzevii ZP591]|nr:hypothetical protein SKDZ_02G2910 [Saccharomyces kudriavzevii ZP591]